MLSFDKKRFGLPCVSARELAFFTASNSDSKMQFARSVPTSCKFSIYFSFSRNMERNRFKSGEGRSGKRSLEAHPSISCGGLKLRDCRKTVRLNLGSCGRNVLRFIGNLRTPSPSNLKDRPDRRNSEYRGSTQFRRSFRNLRTRSPRESERAC